MKKPPEAETHLAVVSNVDPWTRFLELAEAQKPKRVALVRLDAPDQTLFEWEWSNAGRIASEAWELARAWDTDAESVTFVLQCETKTGKYQSPARIVGSGMPTLQESANIAGIVKQEMRSKEKLQELFYRACGALADRNERKEQRMQARIDELESMAIRAMKTQQDLLDRQYERDRLREQDERREKRLDGLIDRAKPGVDALVARAMLGKGSKNLEAVAPFVPYVRSIEEDEIEAFAQLLDEDGGARGKMLLGVYRKLTKKDGGDDADSG